MKKSIVMVASYGGPYGGNFIPSLIAYDEVVKELGYRSVYVFPDFVSDYAWVEEMKECADRLYFIPYQQYTLDNIKRIKKICLDEHAVLLYSRMSGWDITARLAMPRLTLIWHMEMGLNLTSIKSRVKYWIKYKILGFGKTYHIAVSDKTVDSINSLHVKNKCVWIPNAINLLRLHMKDALPYIQPIKLLTFAYQPTIKGFDIALDACEVLNKYYVMYELLASAQARTYEYIKKRYPESLPEWLTLVPPTDNISEIFDKADCLLCPSRSEGLSFANLEGLYSGLPVVYSNIPGNRILSDFKMTYCFESCNATDLADKIVQCTKTPISEEFQRENRELIEKKYSMPAWSQKIKEIIFKISNAQEC
ncbi:MAG: glycosyltransferase family 4 protein [Thermoguttaceae bacterium]|nr:glycosyltransferase family 4 protein [Thermoguttaceae bacterium]